ncbi:hypothetical protein [Undibacterium fentianense]|uniref:Uncharacterized protein n=1 Tax=Undibacterium fentianense TaxID=2828728 RepID=A0A941E0B7_9BURK|nr:hypothetical protein [Undibacterium fentianense]MBR7800015.1 hypothetical protein [Undibacterium fentianense]
MNMKQFSLGFALLAFTSVALSQEFVVVPSQSTSQANNQASSQSTCQENCSSEGGQMQIDRSGMDKASIHLQILQQASQKFSEPSFNNKKTANDDKKNPSKSQDNS